MYDTVFDLQQAGYSEWSFPAVGLGLALVFGAVLYYHERLARQRPSQTRRVFAWATPFLLLLWTFSAVRETYGEHHRLLASLKEGKVAVVEGRVTNFVPMPARGHAPESFEVNGQTFCYSDYAVGPGFKNTSVHGGPIRDGLQVRVTHVDGVIVRLEIARDPETKSQARLNALATQISTLQAQLAQGHGSQAQLNALQRRRRKSSPPPLHPLP